MENSDWPLRELSLKVLDLQKQIAYYQAFGMRILEKNAESALLAAGEGVRLTLKKLKDGKARPRESAGLFHFAILLEDRESLGAFVRFAAHKPFHFAGAADHLVSEALYFSDEEQNGIEVYADRPREFWKSDGKLVQMDTLPMDIEELASLPSPEWNGFSPGTRLGHMHLTVSDTDESQKFYESLGLQLTLDWGTFRFLSWDGYHHHVGINLVRGRNASHVTAEVSGLESFAIQRAALPQERNDPNGIKLIPFGSPTQK